MAAPFATASLTSAHAPSALASATFGQGEPLSRSADLGRVDVLVVLVVTRGCGDG